MSAIPLEKEVEYPTSDGQPMAESPLHQTVMIDLLHGLKGRYANDPDVWVAGNFFLCYEEGNPRAHVSPDVMVAKGVRKWMRPNYLLWQEKPPTLVVEVTSKSTSSEDQGKKKRIYREIGVEELVLFDPKGEYLRPPLQGFGLEQGSFQPIPLNLGGSLLSRTTGLLFVPEVAPEGKRLRLIDAVTGERILWPDEEQAARLLAEERAAVAEEKAAEEAAARQAAEARAAEAEVRAAEEAAARRALEDQIRALQGELQRRQRNQGG